MKVSNSKVGPSQGKIDAGKAGKAEGAQSLKKDMKAQSVLGALSPKEAKDGSKVDVSERAQLMQKAKDIASNNSVDEAKVARLQKMIDEGKYEVDSEKIADRLMDEHMLIPD